MIAHIYKRFAAAEGPVEYRKALPWLTPSLQELKEHLKNGYYFGAADLPSKPYSPKEKGKKDEGITLPWVVKHNPERFRHYTEVRISPTEK